MGGAFSLISKVDFRTQSVRCQHALWEGVSGIAGYLYHFIILYVNGEYRGDSDIGRLMHDFHCTRAEDMNFEKLTQYMHRDIIFLCTHCVLLLKARAKNGRPDADGTNRGYG